MRLPLLRQGRHPIIRQIGNPYAQANRQNTIPCLRRIGKSQARLRVDFP